MRQIQWIQIRRTARSLSVVLTAIAMTIAIAGFGPCERRDVNPVIFVHGGSGSGAQFESQAMRFTSNGYRQSEIGVVEYDSGALVPGDPAAEAIVIALRDRKEIT
jgi:triacylglycerol esterase/lipase EstA (alpha/beta hydrolase family)